MGQAPLVEGAGSDISEEASDDTEASPLPGTSSRSSESANSPLEAVQAAFSAFSAREDLHSLGPSDHLRWASGLPEADDSPRVPTFLNGHFARSVSMSVAELQTARQSALAFWKHRKLVTDPQWQTIFRSLPAHCQSVLGPEKNLLLLKEMLEAIAWPNNTLFRNLCNGFPLVGRLPASGIHAPAAKSPEPAETLRSLLAHPRERNEATLGRIAAEKGGDTRVRTQFLSACSKEVEDGKARFRNLDVDSCVLTARFPIVQGEKDGMPKIRCIDDFTASAVNGAVVHSERTCPDTLDTLVALVRHAAAGKQHIAMRWRKDDFWHAFKTLPICSGHLPLAATAWPEAVADGKALQLLCLPFGSSASVSGWDRFGLAIQGILAALFHLLYLRFVDDMFAGDSALEGRDIGSDCLIGPAGSARLARAVVSELLGWDLDAGKAVTEATKTVILGVCVEFDDHNQLIQFSLEAERLEKWTAEIREALRRRSLSPARALKLAGKLSWGATAVFGRGARVYLAAIYHHGSGNQSRLSQRTKLCLRWWLRFLQEPPSRSVPVMRRQKKRCILYTDATGQGRMAWVIQTPCLKAWAAADVPAKARQWVLHRKNQIGTWELMAALCALKFLLSYLPGEFEILAFVDNTSALGALLRGCSRQFDWNELIGELWFAVAQRGHYLHLWHVPSHLNLADAPTRPEAKSEQLRKLAADGFQEMPWSFPADAPW